MDCEVIREIVGVGFGESGPADDAGVVDQDVDAPEPFDRPVDECPGSGLRRHVVAVGDGAPARLGDLGRDGGRGGRVGPDAFHGPAEVVDHDGRARAASSRAWARPMPRPAPVTTATRPSKLCSFTASLAPTLLRVPTGPL